MPRRMTRIVPRKFDVEAAIVTVGANMRRLRLGHNMSQHTAAELAGLNWRHWQKIEHAKTSATVSSLARIAAALDVDIADLFAPLP
jgi:transcriptional regulator with XRE-family HTH domain